MALTDEQTEYLRKLGRPRASRGVTEAQAIISASTAALRVFSLEGLEPLPSEEDVRAVLKLLPPRGPETAQIAREGRAQG